MTAPLLNEYKLRFALKRLFSTVTGCLWIESSNRSSILHTVILHSLQSLLFFLPFLVSGLCYLIGLSLEWGSMANVIVGVVHGSLIGLVQGVMSTAHHQSIRHSKRKIVDSTLKPPPSTRHIESCDSEYGLLDLDSERPIWACFDYYFNQSLDLPKGYVLWIRVLLNAILTGILQSACSSYLSPRGWLTLQFTAPIIWIIFVLGWYTVCVTQMVLARGPVPEPNTFHAVQTFGMNSYTRPFYLLFILFLKGTETWSPVLNTANVALAFVFGLFPLIWTCGLLPTVSIFYQFGLEQVSFYLIGSGPMMSMQIALMDVFMTLLFSLISAFLSYNSFANFALLLLASTSCLLSSRLWIDVLSKFSSNDGSLKLNMATSINFLVRFIASLVIALSIGLPGLNFTWTIMHPATPGIHYSVLATIILHLLLQKIQQLLSIQSKPLKLNVIVIGYRTTLLLLPYLLVTWICLSSLWPPMNGSQSVPMTLSDSQFGNHVFMCLLMLKSCRSAWQNTRGLSWDWLLILFVNAVISGSSQQVLEYWNTLNILVRLLLSHLVREIGCRMLERSWMWILCLKHFLCNRKQRIDGWAYYLPIILIVSPVTIILSSILNAPAMPILGLPLLWTGFPRPKRMWPIIENNYQADEEALFYTSMAPSISKNLGLSISEGRIPPLQPGDVLVVRFEARIIFIRAIEAWFEGSSVCLIGSELEPTSCHALEGAEVDTVLESLLDSSNQGTFISAHFMHSLKPLFKLDVEAYSESKIVTTGILDHPSTLTKIPIVFFKSLVYVLLIDEVCISCKNTPISGDILSVCWKKFPVKWFDYLKNHSACHTSSDVGQSEADQSLMLMCVALFVTILGIVSPMNIDPLLTQTLIFQLFKGNLPSGTQYEIKDWFFSPEVSDLRQAGLKAFRYAIKLSFDQAIEGEPQSFEELESILNEYNESWLITVDPKQAHPLDMKSGKDAFAIAVATHVPSIFSLSQSKESGVLSVRLLRLQPCQVKVGSLNSSAVEGIWANLAFELLYLTNDDEERYSIQAHELLLRNLIIQMASPPFGYPIWMSTTHVCHDLLAFMKNDDRH